MLHRKGGLHLTGTLIKNHDIMPQAQEKSRSRPTGILPASHPAASPERDPFDVLMNVIREEAARTRADQVEFFQKTFGYFQEQQTIRTETLVVAQQAMQRVSDAINEALEKSTRETALLKNVLDQFASSHGPAGPHSTTVFQQPDHGAPGTTTTTTANSPTQRLSGPSNISMERIMAGSTSSVSQALESARKRIRLADANSATGDPLSSSSSPSPSSPSSSPASAPRNIAPRDLAGHHEPVGIRPAPGAPVSTSSSASSSRRIGQTKTFGNRAKVLSQARTSAQGASSSNGSSSSHPHSLDLTASDDPSRLPADLVPDTFEMSRGIETVREVWDEWTVGLSPFLPSVEQMDKKHGTKWRNSIKERKFYSNRLVIIREIRRLSTMTGQSVDDVIDMLDREVRSTSWTRMVTRLRREHMARTVMPHAAAPITDDEHDTVDHGREENDPEY